MASSRPKSSLGKGDLFILPLSSPTPSPKEVRLGVQGRNVEAGTGVGEMEGCCFLTFLLMACSARLILCKISCPGVTWPTTGGALSQ